ncbi:MAG: hypothetical protein ACIAQF_05930 [Phycisphaerales bacterium JB065]
MKHICLTALLFCCIGLATLAIAAEPHNSHPADGDPLLILNFKTNDFSFTQVETRECKSGNENAWSLKGFMARHESERVIPFSIVLTRDDVQQANQQWDFGEENPNILAVLQEGDAVTHFDLEPVDAAERTIIIENVRNGMSGQVKWSRSLDKRFGELVAGARSPEHASAFLANAVFTFIDYPDHVNRGAGSGSTLEQCFETAEKACSKRCPQQQGTQPCLATFNWQPDGSCSFTCLSLEECCGAGGGG